MSSTSGSAAAGFPLGVRLSGVAVAADVGLATNLELFTRPGTGSGRNGDAGGVVCRNGEDVTGDSGRRNGELRGDPYPSGDGLYPVGTDYWFFVECQHYLVSMILDDLVCGKLNTMIASETPLDC